MYTLYRHQAILSHISLIHITPHFTALLLYKASRQISCYSFLCEENTNQSSVLDWSYNKKVSPLAQLIEGLSPSHASHQLQQLSSLKGSKPERASIQAYSRLLTEIDCSVCNLSTKEHKSKSAAITQTGNRVQDLAGVRNETKSSESKVGKAQVSICGVCRSNWWSCI